MAQTVVPPNGGWGWMIVVSTFFITFLSFGTIYSIGIIFDDLIAEFGCTKSEVSIIASILFSLQCFLGPFVSLLQQKFQDKNIVLVGCIIISTSFVASAFAPDVLYLCFTVGVLGGIGSALVYMPLVVLITFYFHRQRSLATALGCLGGHVGAFIHPYLLRSLVSFYDWRGALFIIGALVLNSLAMAFLLRPVEKMHLPSLKRRPEKVKAKSPVSCDTEEDASRGFETFISLNILGCQPKNEPNTKNNGQPQLSPSCEFNGDARLILAETHDTFEIPTSSANTGTGVCLTPQRNRSGSCTATPKSKLRSNLSGPYSFLRQLSEKVESSIPSFPSVRNRQASVPSLDKRLLAINDGISTIPATPSEVRKTSQLNRPAPLARLSSIVNSSILSIPMFDPVLAPASLFDGLHEEEGSQPMTPLSIVPNYEEQCDVYLEKIPAKDENDETVASTSSISPPAYQQARPASVDVSMSLSLADDKPVEKSNRFYATMKPFFRHFANPDFTAFVASNFLLCLAYYTPSVFIVNWGSQLDMSTEKTTLLLSLIGLGNIVGRPLLALSADKWANFRIPLFALMIGIAGAVTTITPMLADFYFLAFFVFQFGFLAGASQTLLTPILADMVPLAELSHAFGILILVDGIALLIGPPLLAILPSYDYTFAVSGLIMMTSSLALIVPTYAHRFLRKSNKAANGSIYICRPRNVQRQGSNSVRNVDQND